MGWWRMARRTVGLEVRGFKESRIAFRELVKAMDPAASSDRVRGLYRIAQNGIRDALSAGGDFARDAARSMAATTRAPKRLFSGPRPAIFSFSDWYAANDGRHKRSVLVGVRTGLSRHAPDPSLYIQWSPKSNKRRKDGSAINYKWLGRYFDSGLSMSLGALFERGTQNRRIKPKNFFRFGVASAQSRIFSLVGSAYRRAVVILNQNTSK